MLQINNAKTAKKSARALEKFLARSGVELGHGKALDAIAVLSGFKDWNSMARATSPEALNEQLADFELSHMEYNLENDYGAECAAVVHTGFELRYSAEGDVVDYVRVCDPAGREIAYWVDDEWAEDPQLVMGAILGALMRGRPQLRGKPRTATPEVATAKVSAQSTSATVRTKQGAATHDDAMDLGNNCGTRPIADKAAAASPVSIQDVPLEDVSNVLINGVPYSRRYCDSQVLGLLYEPAGDEDAESDCHHTVLELVRNEDGLEWEESVSLAELRSMTWSAERGCFKSAGGDEYVFFTEQRFSPTQGVSQDKPAQVYPSSPEPATDPKGVSSNELKLYSAEVYAQGCGDVSHLGTWHGVALNENEARVKAMDKFWDDRLDGAGCHAVVDVEEDDEDNHAPFKVLITKDIYFHVGSLAEGIQTANLLIERTDHRRVSIVNADENELLVLTR